MNHSLATPFPLSPIAMPQVLCRPIPWRDPVEAFAAIRRRPRPVLLDSALVDGTRGRWSLVAADPFRWFEVGAAEAPADPFDSISALLARYRIEPDPERPPLGPGAIGFLGYEAGRFADRMPAPQPVGLDLPDIAFGLYDCVAVFDVVERRGWVLSAGWPEEDPAACRSRAEARADDLAAAIAGAPPLPPPDVTLRGVWRSEMPADVHRDGVRRIRDWIAAGDIYQANLTQRFLADLPDGLDPFTLHRRLRAFSPAPFAAFLDLGEGRWIASASPERFLSVDAAGRVETRPIKGTRPRGVDPAADAALAAELQASTKDRAENLMIVDLLRNDLSKVCAVGSVRVPVLCGLETFPRVHHLVSVVEGRLATGRSAVDLLRACFPGGSITGAPKIRAMEIIRELEPARRGPYCGSIVHLGFDGSMDSSIVIRTLCGAQGQVAAQAGGGIVYDSDPDAEYDEAMVKVRPLLQALAGPG
ncbi:aminodeoxychorismate synthase component I [Inquilinus limosus]|uniref:aminodeoxychorismate synthase component I n=1 Tax=Inquilinus limosus TaxID=171674 RepID=UPI000422351E|nr:aminodeoxychorismate synthase component I [Inquilinus limosus]